MRKSMCGTLLAVLLAVPALQAANQEKDAKKLKQELNRISLTAAVMDGRRVVNRVMAEQLGVSRKQLVEERKQTGLVYGELFTAHEVARLAGVPFSQVVPQLDEGKDVVELAAERQVELQTILADAKKLNKKVDGQLDRIANGEENEDAEDSADGYDPGDDSLNADTSSFSPAQIAQATTRIRNRGPQSGQGGFSSASPGAGAGPGGMGAARSTGRGRGRP